MRGVEWSPLWDNDKVESTGDISKIMSGEIESAIVDDAGVWIGGAGRLGISIGKLAVCWRRVPMDSRPSLSAFRVSMGDWRRVCERIGEMDNRRTQAERRKAVRRLARLGKRYAKGLLRRCRQMAEWSWKRAMGKRGLEKKKRGQCHDESRRR
jgi:hypothetical protein